ncbi:Crp/Fnr family transcriptional regulator [Halodesulfovibrio marinisediminis]|uniref:cAMP-binding domain of CRP or a regulatory subunit of cAMP-dependent protein kinases n=1 Tax=Halodesulfovibrio marinisediminis DSM 17456 TaxID=1121457 RepID=A0A1N6IRZ0_9BACT|nr:Crp/Fnr family transcriptional regulator [Halodesulfovibrio marinisediminis]SIO34724.1 cAMP-binding domain of CRP or a regulatory subunit of cAMP-dependent protein kinases [Halodesulfovibrio marinisediminis DSM 17456]
MKFAEINLLAELEKPEFKELRTALNERKFVATEMIADPFSAADDEITKPDASASGCVFIVKEGRLRVFLSAEGKEFTLSILEPGDIYTCHTGTFVQALTPGLLLTTSIPVFHAYMRDIPQVSKVMVRILGNMLKSSFGIIDGLVFGDASTRLTDFLLSIAKDEGGKQVARLGMTGEQLAQHIGSTRQTASTLLNDMVRSGILIRVKRGVFEIVDRTRLEELKK